MLSSRRQVFVVLLFKQARQVETTRVGQLAAVVQLGICTILSTGKSREQNFGCSLGPFLQSRHVSPFCRRRDFGLDEYAARRSFPSLGADFDASASASQTGGIFLK